MINFVIRGAGICRGFARKVRKPLPIIASKGPLIESKKVNTRSFMDDEDEDIYIMDEPLANTKFKEHQSVQAIIKRLDAQLSSADSSAKIFRYFSLGKNNKEIIEKIANFPVNYLSKEFLDSEMEPRIKNFEEDEEIKQGLINSLEKLRIDNMLRRIPEAKMRKLIKGSSKHKDIQLQSFKFELISQGLIPDADEDLIERITWDHFEKYSVIDDPEAEEMEQKALESYVDTKLDRSIMALLEQRNSIIDDDVEEGKAMDKLDFIDEPLLNRSDESVGLTIKEKSDIEAKRISKKFGIALKDAKDMMKEYVFLRKKEEEENLKLKERFFKKQQIKEIKKQQEKINKANLEFEEFESFTPKIVKSIREEYGEFVKVSKHILPDDSRKTTREKAFDVFQSRTKGNIQMFLEKKISTDLTYIPEIFEGYQYKVHNIILNDGITVAKVYWSLQSDTSVTIDHSDDQKERIKRIGERLNRLGRQKLSPQMFVEFGLKKPLEIRFLYTKKDIELGKSTMHLKQIAIDQAKSEINIKIKEGIIRENGVTPEIFRKYFEKNYQKLRNALDSRFQFNKEDALAENKPKERVRNHKNPDGSRNRTRKGAQAKIKSFWNELN